VIAEHYFEVVAVCPVDDRTDWYECIVRTRRVIPVEDILAAAESMRGRKVYQEELTADLCRKLSAEVETVGHHSGVKTRVVCGMASRD
jgi:heterodisulfide reductase subunit C